MPLNASLPWPLATGKIIAKRYFIIEKIIDFSL